MPQFSFIIIETENSKSRIIFDSVEKEYSRKQFILEKQKTLELETERANTDRCQKQMKACPVITGISKQLQLRIENS